MPGLKLVDSGRVSLAKRVFNSNICLGLGSGQASWSTPPPDPVSTDAALLTPIAMIRPTQKSYVAPDTAGVIEMADGSKWSTSATPTRFIYVRYALQFNEGPTDTYRELGLYLDPSFVAAVTAGQNYIPWAQVSAIGDLFCLERFNAMDGTATKETFERIVGL